MTNSSDHDVVIIGAGPAGLACAYEAVQQGVRPLVLEKDDRVGGIARTETLGECRFDRGPHRFFTKEPEIQAVWESLLSEDFLVRARLTRIYYGQRFFDYPLRLLPTLRKLGLGTSLAIVASYLRAQISRNPSPDNFEQWVVNRFGRRLYEMFFRSYTEKVWGVPCTQISADWAAQRIKDLSLLEILRNALPGARRQHTSLIEEFHYPRRGASMMWEAMTQAVEAGGGEVRLDSPVEHLEHSAGRITALQVAQERLPLERADVVSSAPLRDLILSLSPGSPQDVLAAARALRYRAILIVGLVIPVADLFPDNWIYVHSPQVRVGRIQNSKNFSPQLVPNPALSCLALEYYSWQGDEVWSMADEALITLAGNELHELGLLADEQVIAGKVIRIPHAYPVYDPGYQDRVRIIREYLAGFANLQVIGRAGMHRYNNMDHSMLTGIQATRNLVCESHDLWLINIEQEYLEQDRSE